MALVAGDLVFQLSAAAQFLASQPEVGVADADKKVVWPDGTLTTYNDDGSVSVITDNPNPAFPVNSRVEAVIWNFAGRATGVVVRNFIEGGVPGVVVRLDSGVYYLNAEAFFTRVQ